MGLRVLVAGGLACMLAACTQVVPPVVQPVTAPAFQSGLVTEAPRRVEGQCWHALARPALFETVTEQVQVSEEVRDASGAVLRPAVFRTETRQTELRPRETVWYRIPCRSEVALESVFVASLQRALKARGLFGGAVTGEMDAATEAAVYRYQAANGLESSVLSLAAAQALGLLAVAG